MGVMAARGEESNAGTGTPRAGGGTAPGGRNVAVAGATLCSSESVGMAARARFGGGGGCEEDGRAGIEERRGGPIVPKLLGAALAASAMAAASSATRLAGNHSAQPERQTSVPLRKTPLLSPARSSRSLPDMRAPSAASQKY
jgi:hypothetical protein